MAKCAKGMQNARFSSRQKISQEPPREEKHAEQEPPLHYTHECQHQPSKVGPSQPHSFPTSLVDLNTYTRYWVLLGEVSVRFSCNLYFRFFQSIFLIYVYNLKSAISALFWTVLVSVNQEFL